jgi:hypothetical protein
MVALVGIVRIVSTGASDGRVLLPLAVLQMFAVSTGFVTYARRGYFDVLFTAGIPPALVAGVYWFMAAAPGLSWWVALTLVDVAVHGSNALLSPSAIAALASVSMLPWATTVALTRFTGAIAWSLVMVVAGTLVPFTHVQDLITGYGSPPGWLLSVAFAVCPLPMARHDAALSWEVVSPALVLAGSAMAAALWWVAHGDVPLETGQ